MVWNHFEVLGKKISKLDNNSQEALKLLVYMYLVLACCWETSKRVLICSETTPNARKPTQASPAPSPNLLVNEVAIQSVESTLVLLALEDELEASTAFIGFCCSAFTGSGTGDCWGGGGGGGGACDDEEMWWVLVSGREKMGGEPKKVAIFLRWKKRKKSLVF